MLRSKRAAAFETTLMSALVVYNACVLVRGGHRRCCGGRGKRDGESRLNQCWILG